MSYLPSDVHDYGWPKIAQLIAMHDYTDPGSEWWLFKTLQNASCEIAKKAREIQEVCEYEDENPCPIERGKRCAIPLDIKYKVMSRDGFECVYCGASGRHAELCIDHIVPVRVGGTDHISNLQTLCRSCNSKKSGKV